jgi:hypothetical protein
MHWQGQVTVNEADLAWIARQQLLVNLRIPLLAIGALVIAEFDNGNRGILRSKGRLTIRCNGHTLDPVRVRRSRRIHMAPEQVPGPQTKDECNWNEEVSIWGKETSLFPCGTGGHAAHYNMLP